MTAINFETLNPIELLPHRDPMLLIDKVLHTDFKSNITTATKINADGVFLKGHFPGYPLLPGVFIIEMMFQACGILNRISKVDFDSTAKSTKIGKAVKIKSAVFYKEVLPESLLVINAEKIQSILNFSEYKAIATVDGKKVCQAENHRFNLIYMKNQTKIFITGLGSISALGYGAQAAWENILSEESSVKIKNDWANPKIKSQFFGEVPNVEFANEVKWDERFPPQLYSRLGILACKKALDDAQIKLEALDNEIGLIIETSLGATASVEDYLYDLYRHGLPKISPLKFTKTVANTVLGDISRTFKLNGPSSLLYNSNSITYGIDLIRKGMADIVICGGVDHYTEYRILSEQESNNLVAVGDDKNVHHAVANETESQRNILGDGAAFIVLESEASKLKRNVKSYAELVEYHNSFDYENVEDATQRSLNIGEGAFKMLKDLIQSKEKIAYLSAYTTGAQTEKSEGHVVEKIRKENEAYSFSHKTYTGDMKAASGVMGASIASQILYNNLFPVKEASGKHPSGFGYAFVNTAHEGGGSSHLIFKQSNS